MRIIFYSILILLASSCLTDSEKNRIVLKDSVSSVEESLKKMNSLMDKIPFPTGINKNYSLNGEDLFINGENLGSIKHLKIDTVFCLQNFEKDEKDEFLRLVFFLNENYVTSTYWDKSSEIYLYSYRTTIYDSFKMSRRIFLWQEPLDSIRKTLFAERKILDHKQDLILIGYK